jgi:hypothetical protein
MRSCNQWCCSSKTTRSFLIHGPSINFGKWIWNKELDNLLGNQGSISLLSNRLLDQRIQENKFVLIHWPPIECGTQSLLCWFQWWIVPLGTQLECLGQPLLQIRVTFRCYHVPMFEILFIFSILTQMKIWIWIIKSWSIIYIYGLTKYSKSEFWTRFFFEFQFF